MGMFDGLGGPDVVAARHQRIGDLPRRAARRTPDKVAIIDGDVRLTFADFDERVDRFSQALHAAGLGRGDTLALLSHNCWQFPAIAFAAARRGVVLVPVNFMLGAAEIAWILDHCEASAFVVEDALVPVATDALAACGREVPVRARIDLDPSVALPSDGGWVPVAGWLDHEPCALPDVELGDDEPVRIMYTSGTESRPKGAVLGSRSLIWQYTSCIVTGGMEAEDVELHSMPLYHCAQLDNFLSTKIYLGATSVILRRPDPDAILAAIERHRITNLFVPPTVWISLLASPAFASTDLSSLRKGYYGASAMPTQVLRELTERAPELRLWNFYGQTEMASLATALPPAEQFTHGGSAGYPALNVETIIVDDDDVELSAGEVGEIVHRSPHLILGYLKDPERTAEAFKGGWFHSGDLGYFDPDGRLYVVDRKKDMIKTGGENVSSREVEDALFEHPAVGEVAVFGVPHPRWIEAVTAVVVPRAGAEVSPDELIEFARTRLAGFKAPKTVVLADSLPKNPSGKILKRDLRQTYAVTD
ncbi:fatty acyl-CoA synthetase [Nocardioides sp. AE5]|uniref:fatty acyl-CoA synthetase n=1 Tax=Nocardioides sp. AE5 TaxID=2962573 RepID=UPI0028820F0A|nr:fatty acyl-CoA synthetase [Nocardioides sp. AE5]MDT0203248.1 fatty acyl-CoA synthetase [Nocardioides sp. AE5]